MATENNVDLPESPLSQETIPIPTITIPALATSHQFLPLIPDFDGNASILSDFFSKLDLIADVAGWTETEKVKFALLKLKDKALQFALVHKLNESTYTNFKSALNAQFAHNEEHFANVARFVNCKQNITESIANYSFRIRSLANKAMRHYPTMEQQNFEIERIETDLLDRFMQGLLSHIRPFVTMGNPKSFNEAIKLALRYEATNPPTIPTLQTQQTSTTLAPQSSQTGSRVGNAEPPKSFNRSRNRDRKENAENRYRNANVPNSKEATIPRNYYSSRNSTDTYQNKETKGSTNYERNRNKSLTRMPRISPDRSPQRYKDRNNSRRLYSQVVKRSFSPIPNRGPRDAPRQNNGRENQPRSPAGEYPNCVFCKKTNHPASLCFFKPGGKYANGNSRRGNY